MQERLLYPITNRFNFKNSPLAMKVFDTVRKNAS